MTAAVLLLLLGSPWARAAPSPKDQAWRDADVARRRASAAAPVLAAGVGAGAATIFMARAGLDTGPTVSVGLLAVGGMATGGMLAASAGRRSREGLFRLRIDEPADAVRPIGLTTYAAGMVLTVVALAAGGANEDAGYAPLGAVGLGIAALGGGVLIYDANSTRYALEDALYATAPAAPAARVAVAPWVGSDARGVVIRVVY